MGEGVLRTQDTLPTLICITISVMQVLNYLYGDFLHAAIKLGLWNRALTSSHPINEVYQMVRPTTSSGQTECMQPAESLNYPHWGRFKQPLKQLFQKFEQLNRCVTSWGDPGTSFYWAWLPLAVMLDKFVRRAVSKMEIDVSKSACISIHPKMDLSINPIPQWGKRYHCQKLGSAPGLIIMTNPLFTIININ